MANLSCLLMLLFCYVRISFSGEVRSFDSVPDLVNSMYKIVDGLPCVRLLNTSGEIGCSNPGPSKVVAPIIRFRNSEALIQPSAILLSSDEIQNFFTRISRDSDFVSKVVGVLIESGTEFQNRLGGFSPDEKFPQANFAPYVEINYEWNPSGSGILWNNYNFPIFLLSENGTMTLQEAVDKNEKTPNKFTKNVAEFELVMQTTKFGTRNSESCLKEGTCLPLGGYSVWSSLPPINISSEHPKPVILTVASMDSVSFFRDKSIGAESPISGLISLLAAVDALSHVDALNDFSKQLVFLIFTGESWGYLGSRRFLLELDLHSEAINGLNNTLIEMVVEIGSVGKASSEGINHFFAHAAGTSSTTNETLDALKLAQDSLKSESTKISTANTSNPGVPPSSLMSFLRKNSLTAGFVLEDFDTIFTNTFYHSQFDDISNINSSSIALAATIVARTLYILGNGNRNLIASAVSDIKANLSLVEELIGCLLNCDPGLSCKLVKQYIEPNYICPNHYVGVISGEPSATPDIGYVGDISRFLWNFMAQMTSLPTKSSSACPKNCSNIGEVCVGVEIDGKGNCVISTTRYVPAYSTRLKLNSRTWEILPENSADMMGIADPIWTESNWDIIGLRVYEVQDASYDHAILVFGFSLTGFSYIAILISKNFISKALKQD